MNNSIVSKKLVGAFLAVGLLAILIAIIGSWTGRRQTSNNQSNEQNLVQATTITKTVDNSKLPDNFPANFPQEPGAVILRNDVQTSADGKLQATRSYVTVKSLADNFKLFQDYLKKNNWTVTVLANQTDHKTLGATKDNLSLQVNLNDNQLTKQKTVDLYLIQTIAK